MEYNKPDRKYCDYCNCWYANNKIQSLAPKNPKSITNHEQGASHKVNVRRKLEEATRRDSDRQSSEKALLVELARIETLAMKSFKEDAKRDPFARNELNRVIDAKAGKVPPGPSYRRQPIDD